LNFFDALWTNCLSPVSKGRVFSPGVYPDAFSFLAPFPGQVCSVEPDLFFRFRSSLFDGATFQAFSDGWSVRLGTAAVELSPFFFPLLFVVFDPPRPPWLVRCQRGLGSGRASTRAFLYTDVFVSLFFFPDSSGFLPYHPGVG